MNDDEILDELGETQVNPLTQTLLEIARTQTQEEQEKIKAEFDSGRFLG